MTPEEFDAALQDVINSKAAAISAAEALVNEANVQVNNATAAITAAQQLKTQWTSLQASANAVLTALGG